jgi:hypothetical protein
MQTGSHDIRRNLKTPENMHINQQYASGEYLQSIDGTYEETNDPFILERWKAERI